MQLSKEICPYLYVLMNKVFQVINLKLKTKMSKCLNYIIYSFRALILLHVNIFSH